MFFQSSYVYPYQIPNSIYHQPAQSQAPRIEGATDRRFHGAGDGEVMRELRIDFPRHIYR